MHMGVQHMREQGSTDSSDSKQKSIAIDGRTC